MLSAVLKKGNPGIHRLKTRSTHFDLVSTFLLSRYSLAQTRNHRPQTSSTRSIALIKTGGHRDGSAFRPVPAFVSAPPSHLSRSPRVGMTLEHRRAHSTENKNDHEDHTDKNGHKCGKTHTHHEHNNHSHPFPLFGHSHSHSEEHSRDAEKIIEALKGTGLCCWLIAV